MYRNTKRIKIITPLFIIIALFNGCAVTDYLVDNYKANVKNRTKHTNSETAREEAKQHFIAIKTI